MRGQYLTIEYLLFFTIGIIMLISVYYLFSGLSDEYRKATTDFQLQMTGQMIMGSIIRIAETSTSTDSQINYNLSIPRRVSNCVYSIRTTNTEFILECIEPDDVSISLTTYNFNIRIRNDILYSTNGLLQMTAENGVIDLK